MNREQMLAGTLHQLERFCQQELWPKLEEDDEQRRFRLELFRGLGELGMCGVTTSETYSGSSLPYLDFVKILEKLAQYSVGYAVTVSVSSMVQGMIEAFGSEQQKQDFLPPMATGQEIGAFCLSESSSGSDAASLKTSAKKIGNTYQLSGRKMWITSAGVAKTYLVMAKTEIDNPKSISAFIVRDGDPGLSFGKNEKKMGWRISPTREVILENCQIPADRLIGKEGEGLKIAFSALDRGRFTIGALGVGLAQAAFNRALEYSLIRQQFNQPIFDFQGLQFMLADMATEIEASRLLVYKAAADFDEGILNPRLSAMAKLKATDTAMQVTTDAVQILGGVGYTQEYPLERFMRDAKVLQIVEGTNQIQRVVIARSLKKGAKNG